MMCKRVKRPMITTGMLYALLSGPLLAEQSIQFGLVGAVNSSFYTGAGEDSYLLPLALVDYGRFYLKGIDGGYRFFQHDEQSLAVEIGRTFDGYESNDSDELKGMEEREQAWEAGLAYARGLLGGQAKAKLMHDISDTHGGYTARLEYEHPFLSGSDYMVNWFGGSELWSRKKTDYYFGVTPEEATSGRSSYRAEESYSLFAGLNGVKRLNARFSLIASAEYQWMSDEIGDSPITTRQDQWSFYAGIFYQY